MLEINHIRNFEEFSYIFSSHLCFNENVDREVVVVGEIAKETPEDNRRSGDIRMTQLNMKDQGFRDFFSVVTAISDETLSPVKKRCYNVGLRRHCLDLTGAETCLQFVFLVWCMCIGLC
jgi:hypothetical protein